MRLLEPFVFFLDRSLGKGGVVSSLRSALEPDETLHVHDDLLPQDTDDREWLSLVGRHRWIALSKDDRIRHNPLEPSALLYARAAVFLLGRASLTGAQQGAALVQALPLIRRAVRRFKLAIVAIIDVAGHVTVLYAEGQKLDSPKRYR